MAKAIRAPQRRGEIVDTERGLGVLGLLALIAGGLALGIALFQIDGGPRTPDWPYLREVLTGSLSFETPI